MEVKKYIQENEERFLKELESLIRIPSISAKAEHKNKSQSNSNNLLHDFLPPRECFLVR